MVSEEDWILYMDATRTIMSEASAGFWRYLNFGAGLELWTRKHVDKWGWIVNTSLCRYHNNPVKTHCYILQVVFTHLLI